MSSLLGSGADSSGSSDSIPRMPIPGDGPENVSPVIAPRARITSDVPADTTRARPATPSEKAVAAGASTDLNPGRDAFVSNRGRPPLTRKGRAMSVYFRDADTAEDLLALCGSSGGSASRTIEALVKALLDAHKLTPTTPQLTITVNLHL